MSTHNLGEVEFHTNKAIREYCDRVRKASHILGLEIAMAAAELEATLSQIPGQTGLFGADSKMRARMVSRHLKSSSDAMRSCAAAAARTYGSFRKHFAIELDSIGMNSKKKFTFVPD